MSMSAYDVISMTLAILDQVEVRGQGNITAMKNAMENLEALKNAFRQAKEEQHDHHDQQG